MISAPFMAKLDTRIAVSRGKQWDVDLREMVLEEVFIGTDGMESTSATVGKREQSIIPKEEADNTITNLTAK